jgi:hypothetical protein
MEKKVLLLALLKKEADESEKEVLFMLANARVFTLKEGKRLLKELKAQGYVNEGGLTPKGVALAKQAEEEFLL